MVAEKKKPYRHPFPVRVAIAGLFIAAFVGGPVRMWLDSCGTEPPPTPTPTRPVAVNDEEFVCRATNQKWPDGVKDAQRMVRDCKREGVTSQACKALALSKVMEACRKLHDSRHGTACARYDSEKFSAIGDQIWEEAAKSISIRRDARITALGRRLVDARSRRCFKGDVDFFVYDDPHGSINAFTVPNGKIAIGADLLGALPESALAAVMGHEIAHLERGSFDLIAVAIAFGENDAFLPKLNDLLLAVAGICESGMDEVRADVYGLELAEKLGYEPMAAVRIEVEVFSDGRRLDSFDGNGSHPPSEFRAMRMAVAARKMAYNDTLGWGEVAYYRGERGILRGWDGTVPASVSTKCGRGPDATEYCTCYKTKVEGAVESFTACRRTKDKCEKLRKKANRGKKPFIKGSASRQCVAVPGDPTLKLPSDAWGGSKLPGRHLARGVCLVP